MTGDLAGSVDDVTISGFIEAIEVETRRRAFVKVALVAGVIALKPGGPSRLLFSGGGHIDVCGGAPQWAMLLRLHELKDSVPVASASNQNHNNERQ